MTNTESTQSPIEYRNILDLVPHPDNPRRGNVDEIMESIQKNGFVGALVVQKSTQHILAGNHRWKAARALGMEVLPVMTIDCDDATAQRILLADNRTSDTATYDTETLARVLQEAAESRNLEGTLYTSDDLDALLQKLRTEERPKVNTDPDDAPALDHTPSVTKPGDIWTLGNHRLICGDSTDPKVLEALMADDIADLVWTDPPYGVAIVGGSHQLSPEERRRRGGLEIQNDALDPQRLEEFLQNSLSLAASHTKPGGCWYVTAPAGPLFAPFASVLGRLGIWRQTLVWVKDSLVMGRSDYHYKHEAMFYGWMPGETPPVYDVTHDAVFYGWRPGAAHQAPDNRAQQTVWEIPRPKRSAEHPTMKPVALITKAIENSTNVEDIVLDPFAGSGSTLIAAHMTHRHARVVELDPRYCDVIVTRYEQLTGETATRG